eukprot:gene15025-biopygen15708
MWWTRPNTSETRPRPVVPAAAGARLRRRPPFTVTDKHSLVALTDLQANVCKTAAAGGGGSQPEAQSRDARAAGVARRCTSKGPPAPAGTVAPGAFGDCGRRRRTLRRSRGFREPLRAGQFPGSPAARFRLRWPVSAHGRMSVVQHTWKDRIRNCPKMRWSTSSPPGTATGVVL